MQPSEEEMEWWTYPQDTQDQVNFIKKFLITEEHRKWLFNHDISLYELLTGEYSYSLRDDVYSILYDPWNVKLKAWGLRGFGVPEESQGL